tara:strand:+ start:5389 stop:5625 length:237 start_codon:yes stop_codon:yes gene_type:complete
MSLEQYKDANRRGLWEILQIQVERIAELEKALAITSNELSWTIDTVNRNLTKDIKSTDLDDPDYWDKETCHINSVLLK